MVAPTRFEAHHRISESQLYVKSQQNFTFMGLNELVEGLGPGLDAVCPLISS